MCLPLLEAYRALSVLPRSRSRVMRFLWQCSTSRRGNSEASSSLRQLSRTSNWVTWRKKSGWSGITLEIRFSLRKMKGNKEQGKVKMTELIFGLLGKQTSCSLNRGKHVNQIYTHFLQMNNCSETKVMAPCTGRAALTFFSSVSLAFYGIMWAWLGLSTCAHDCEENGRTIDLRPDVKIAVITWLLGS